MLDYSENKYSFMKPHEWVLKTAEWYIIKLFFLKQRYDKYKFQAGVTYVGKAEKWDHEETELWDHTIDDALFPN